MILEEITVWLNSFVEAFSYPGAFILSLISNLILFFPIPYLLFIFWLGAILNPVLLGVISGFAATLGKIVVYYIGFGGRVLLDEEQRRKMEFAKRVMDKYGDLAIFIMAVTPFPDDALYIPLGMIRYNILRFFIFCLLGKVVLTLIITIGGYLSISFIAEFFTAGGGVVGMIVSAIFVVASIYATVKVDWEKIFLRYVSERDDVFKQLDQDREGEGDR